MPPKHKVGTIVLSSDVDVVGQFNKLNALIVHGLPESARAYDTLQRHLPLLRKMQALLSQRPGNADFTMLYRLPLGTLRFAKPAGGPDELPTWTQWITAYANAIDYSVRQIRREINSEPKTKTVKECGWSVTDHNNLIRAATLAFDLVNAIEHGADTVALVQEVQAIMGGVPEDILDKPYKLKRKPGRRRGARPATYDADEVA